MNSNHDQIMNRTRIRSSCSIIIKRSQGVSLIEVLIALLVMSSGLLVFAALQVDGMKQTHAALVRSQAAILTNDMADRMRANVPGAVAGGYDHALVTASTPDCSAGCTPYNLAILEVKEWINSLKQHLPLSSGTISCVDNDATDANPCSQNSTHTVLVSWDNNKDGIANASMQLDVRP